MSWLSVGKSFSSTPAAGIISSSVNNNETVLRVHVDKEESKPEANEIVVRQHIERKRKKKKKERDHSEAKHSKKNKKQKRNNAEFIQNGHSIVKSSDAANFNSTAVVVDDVEDEESISSFDHSSDSDNDMHRSIRSQNAVKLSTVDVVYMPNGQVALLDKDRDVGSTYTWSVDTSMDRDICMFLDIKKTRWSSMRLTIQNTSQNQIKRCAEFTFSSRFCDDVYDWDFMNTKSNSNRDAKSKKWRYYTKSFFQSFADPQQHRLFYDHGTPLADTARSFRLSLQPNLIKDSKTEPKTLAVSQYGFVAVPPVDMSTTGGVLDAAGKAMMTTDSDLAFGRVKAFRQKYSQAELLKGSLGKLLDFLLQQKSLQRWTLLSASGSEPASLRFLKICADWAADKAVIEKILSLIEEHRKLGGESRDHPSIHVLNMKLKINLSPGNIVEQQWRDTILYCPSSFELRLAKWSNLTLSMSTTSVRRTREEHVAMMRSIENDMKNAQLARLLTENMWMNSGAAEDLPLRLQEDINAAKIDATLGLLLLERQLGNVERAIAIVQGLLELNFEVIPKLNASTSKDRTEKAIEALGSFWDSENPRIGEDLSSPFKAGVLSNASGYGHWAENGKTASNSDSTSHLPSDYGPSIRKRLELLHFGGTYSDVIRTVLQGLHGEVKNHELKAKLVPVPSSKEGDSIKEPDVLEMPQSQPQPESKSLKPSAADYMEKDVTEMVTEAKEPEDTAEDGMVYSRIHGYRIPIRQEDSLSSYRRVLEKLHGPTSEGFNGDEEGHGDGEDSEALAGAKGKKRKNESVNNEAWISPYQIMEEDCQQESIEVGYSVRWVHDFLLSSMQWRPLRATFNSHYIATSPGSEDDAIELDRVIFFEDIRDHMFVLAPGKIDAIADGVDLEDSTLGFSFRLHQRMVIRCLEALGLLLPLASCSHSLQRRHLNSHLQADNVAAECCPLLGILHDSSRNAATNGSESSSVPTPSLHRLLMSQQRICLVNKVLSSNHKVGFSLGVDTELNFIIRLLEHILTVSVQSNKAKLTTLFKLHLRSVLMQLAVDRWEASYDCKSACEGNAFLATADVDSVRSYCRDLVESTVLQESNSSSAQDMQCYSSLGSFVAWAAYIRAERQIHLISSKSNSDCIPALKVVDKIFKAVGQQQQSGAATFPAGFMEFNRVSLELLIDCVSTRLKSGHPSALDVQSCQHRHQSCREIAFAAFQMMRCLVSCSAWGESQAASGICYTTFFKFIYSGSGKRSKSENSFAASDITMVVDTLQAKVQSLLNEAKLRVQDARGKRQTEQSIAACRMHMAPCHYIDATPELYDVIYMLTWIQFLAILFVDIDGSLAALTTSKVAAAVHVADSCLLASINLIRELLLGDGAAEDIGIAEAEFLGSSVWDSQIEISLMVLLERLHLCRLLIIEVTMNWLPHCIRIDSTRNSDCNRERRNLLQSLQSAAVTGLKDFPLNSSLLNCLVTCASGLSSGACSLKGCLLTRSYFNSLQSRRLWCGGLMMIEKCFLLYFLIDSANMSARMRSNSWNLRDACGSLGLAIKVGEDGCAEWSDEACSAIVSALEQCLSSTNRDSFFGGDAGLWLLYFHLLSRINTSRKSKSGVSPKIARGLFYRALSASTAGKALWLAAMGPLRGAFAAKELKTIADSLESCGLWLRR